MSETTRKCIECGQPFSIPVWAAEHGGEYDYCGRCSDGDFDEHDGYDDEDDDFEQLVDECGLLPAHLGGGCQLAGTEHCDFDCPFRDNPNLLED